MRDCSLICFGCMGELSAPGQICPHCGWDNSKRFNDKGYLSECILEDQYFVGRVLGHGGFGVTYIGYDMNLSREVAIKEYYPRELAFRDTSDITMHPYSDYANDFRRGCERALDEGRAIAKVRNTLNIVQVFNAFPANGTVYTVMEYIPGRTLTDIVKEKGRLNWREAYEIMRPIMQSLEMVHQGNIIHRDVSPDNVMINSRTGNPVLLDFGAAHMYQDVRGHSYSLRPGYAPAEQYSGLTEQDGRTDEYAVCATMYFMLTGQKPMDATQRIYGDAPMASVRSYAPDIPEAFAKVLMKGMAVRMNDRYPSMNALMEVFDRVAKEPDGGIDGKTVGIIAGGVLIAAALIILLLSAAGVFSDGNHTALPTSTPEATADYSELKRSDRGEPVRRMQARLIELGYLQGVADGVFGFSTENAVKYFQRTVGLKEDGIATAAMQAELYSVNAPFAPKITQAPTDVPTQVPTEVPSQVPTATPIPTNLSAEQRMLRSDVKYEADGSLDLDHMNYVMGTKIKREEVATVTFVNTLANMGSNAVNVSANKDGMVMMWYTKRSDGMYDVFFGTQGKVVLPADCTGLFLKYGNVMSVSFADAVDTSKATDMSWMFDNCSSLSELDVSSFDTQKVTYMYSMFRDCSSLSELDLSAFDTQNVTDMSYMFRGCSSLSELDVSSFDKQNVTNMRGMFYGCSSLRELDVSSFDTRKVTDMSYMFYGCSSLSKLDLSSFDTQNAADMSHMFFNCSSLSELDLSSFVDTRKVADMSAMFCNCSGLSKLDLRAFDTQNVTNMQSMFDGCSSLSELDVSSFDTQKVTNMYAMFYGCSSLSELDLSSFNTQNVSDMASMFYGCSKLEKITVGLSFKVPESSSKMFYGCGTDQLTYPELPAEQRTLRSDVKYKADGSLDRDHMNYVMGTEIKREEVATVTFVDTLANVGSNAVNVSANEDGMVMMWYEKRSDGMYDVFFGTQGKVVLPADCERLFYKYGNVMSVSFADAVDTSKATDMSYMFYGCSSLSALDVSSFDTRKVADMSSMFENCSSLSELDVSSFDTQNVTDMSYMFYGCSSLSALDVSSFVDTQNVTDMSYMFYGCSSLSELDVSSFDTQNVTDMGWMFCACSSLSALDVSSFDTQKVTDMSWMFYNCSSLSELDVSSFDTRNVTDMAYMFRSCSSLSELDVSSFDTRNVTDMSWMFDGCSSLSELDLSKFNTQNVTDMRWMFQNCSKLEKITVGQNFKIAEQSSDMFKGCYTDHLTYPELPVEQRMLRSDVKYKASGSVDWDNQTCVMGTEIKREEVAAVTFVDTLANMGSNAVNVSANEGGMVMMWYEKRSNGMYDVFFGTQGKVVLSEDCTGLFSNYEYMLTIHFGDAVDTQNVTDMEYMFYKCSSLTELDLSSFDTQNVTDMSAMFCNCSGLTALDLSSFDTQNVTDMGYMFYKCSSLTELDLSSFDTQNVNYMMCMFDGCSSLTELDLSSFDTQNVTHMTMMFGGCSSLTELDLSSFDTQNVKYMAEMFDGCSSLTELDLSSFDTRNVMRMERMFYNCSSLTALDLSSFDTRNVKQIWYIFGGCSNLKNITVGQNFKTPKDSRSGMFDGCGTDHLTYR